MEKHEVLGRYYQRSLQLFSEHINDIADAMGEAFTEDPLPAEFPDNIRKVFRRFQGEAYLEIHRTTPQRNIFLSKIHAEVSTAALTLLLDPYDPETGYVNREDLERWAHYNLEAKAKGFDLDRRIITLDEKLDDLVRSGLDVGYVCRHLLCHYSLIGSMFATVPAFTPKWKPAYFYHVLFRSACDVVDNLPEMRYAVRN